PAVDIGLEALHLTATDLRNELAPTGERPARLEVIGTTAASGGLTLTASLAPLAPAPDFYLELELKGVQLPQLNELLRAHASVEIERGTFEAYTEIEARRGTFQGYLKPFFNDVEFTNLEEENRGFVEGLWQTLVSGVVNLFENEER